jgi:hypothetical protein
MQLRIPLPSKDRSDRTAQIGIDTGNAVYQLPFLIDVVNASEGRKSKKICPQIAKHSDLPLKRSFCQQNQPNLMIYKIIANAIAHGFDPPVSRTRLAQPLAQPLSDESERLIPLDGDIRGLVMIGIDHRRHDGVGRYVGRQKRHEVCAIASPILGHDIGQKRNWLHREYLGRNFWRHIVYYLQRNGRVNRLHTRQCGSALSHSSVLCLPQRETGRTYLHHGKPLSKLMSKMDLFLYYILAVLSMHFEYIETRQKYTSNMCHINHAIKKYSEVYAKYYFLILPNYCEI